MYTIKTHENNNCTNQWNTSDDIEEIRCHFPLLTKNDCTQALVYLDNAATTQLPTEVLDTLTTHYSLYNANVHRGNHTLSRISTQHYEKARKSIACYINAPDSNNIIFTSGTTQSINIAAQALEPLANGYDSVIVSAFEHHSNLLPWQQLCARTGMQLHIIPLTEQCDIDLSEYAALLSHNKPLVVAVAHVSNVTGTVNPVAQMAQLAHNNGALFLVDAAQSIRHEVVDVQDLDCDFLCFSGHKTCAPTGIGVLYGKGSLLERLAPIAFGGEMVNTASYTDFVSEEPPLRFEPGTPNYVGAIALGAAIEYLNGIGRHSIHFYEQSLITYAEEKLRKLSGVRILGNPTHRAGCISFVVDDLNSFDVAMFMDAQGVAVRSGSLCAQPLLNSYFQVSSVIRISPAFYNTFQEIDICIEALQRAIRILGS